ncbi:zinc finger and SCAN domain-containing protein 29-like [Danio aesculapii]|uniref:zinc finger and SCAN domain-containing protein 29-like n=1 Tax=Danio aesculapii TaxID=1142201 RepID=UPI0024BFC50E|nr:zinc finger and SCAN domain-containing protein 29-like [Danio aesculapii]
MSASGNQPWSTREVQTFLAIIGEEKVLGNGMVRNERVFQLVSERMAAEGFQQTADQCRLKFKKLRSDYRRIKHNSRRGVNRKKKKWFDTMDAIYGRRPASLERSGGIDTTTSLLESLTNSSVEDPPSQLETTEGFDERLSVCSSSATRTSTPTPLQPAPSPQNGPRRMLFGKRKRGQQDVAAALAKLQASDERHQEWLERVEDRRDQQFKIMLEDIREERRHEAELTRQHMEQMSSFNQAFLGILGQLVQVLSSSRNPA